MAKVNKTQTLQLFFAGLLACSVVNVATVEKAEAKSQQRRVIDSRIRASKKAIKERLEKEREAQKPTTPTTPTVPTTPPKVEVPAPAPAPAPEVALQFPCSSLSASELQTLQICDVRVLSVVGTQATISWKTTKPALDSVAYSEALEDGGLNTWNGNYAGGSSQYQTDHLQTIEFISPNTTHHVSIEATILNADSTSLLEVDVLGASFAAPDASERLVIQTK